MIEKQQQAFTCHKAVCELLEEMPSAFQRANILIKTKDTVYYMEAERLLREIETLENHLRFLRDTAYSTFMEELILD